MSFSIQHFLNCLLTGIRYIPNTVKMTIVVFIISILLGLLVATIRFYKIPVLSQFFAVFVTIYLGVPVLLAINVYYLIYVMFYNDIASFLHLNSSIRDANFAIVAYVTLILTSSCMMSDTFRGAYSSIAPVQFEAGYSIGMSKPRTLMRIIIPQIFPVVLPNMINWFVNILKNMSILFVVGIYDIMNGSLIPCADNYSYAEGYVAAALIYWAVVVIVEYVGNLLEAHSTIYKKVTL